MERRVSPLGLLLVAVVAGVVLPGARSPGIAAEAQSESALLERIERGGTAEDHAALAAYYRNEATAATKQADYHQQAAGKFAPAMGKTDWATHCRSLAEYYRKLAASYDGMAAAHESEAAGLRKKP